VVFAGEDKETKQQWRKSCQRNALGVMVQERLLARGAAAKEKSAPVNTALYCQKY
jgi:hypothetical protein